MTTACPACGVDVPTMSEEELDALPTVVRLWPTAARALGIGRTLAFDLAKRGEFPVRLLKIGNQYRVPTAELRRVLGIDEPPETAT